MKLWHLLFVFLTLSLGSLELVAQTERWQSPESVDGTETIGVDKAKALHDRGTVFIDVRSSRQYNKRHIPGAINLFLNDGFNEPNLLRYVTKETPFVIYCNGISCSLSYRAAEKAVAWGFTQVKYFRSGSKAWRLSGNPLEYGSGR
jgi:rhodanese-related sulfurtransferase